MREFDTCCRGRLLLIDKQIISVISLYENQYKLVLLEGVKNVVKFCVYLTLEQRNWLLHKNS